MKISKFDVDDFARASRDYNSVHFGPEAIAHGCLVLGRAVGQLVEDGDIITGFADVQFRRPVPVGSDVNVRVLADMGRCVQAEVCIGDVQAIVFTMWKAGEKDV